MNASAIQLVAERFDSRFPAPDDASLHRAGRRGLLDQEASGEMSDGEWAALQHREWLAELLGCLAPRSYLRGVRERTMRSNRTAIYPFRVGRTRHFAYGSARLKRPPGAAPRRLIFSMAPLRYAESTSRLACDIVPMGRLRPVASAPLRR